MRTSLSLLAALVSVGPLLAQGFSPEEAVKRMQLPPGFSARVVASEPMIRQPLSISFDEKGRMWVLQYLQYPNPAGLKPVKQDQYLRTVWDRVPEPPPTGPKGLDRITICSDPDENGRYTKSKDFVTGLNLATGFCIGNGGVYVVQPPYLLFYPDKDHDDVPDGGPEVLVSGFGMEDTHSYANSLQWGPDGWLYGAHGSTVTAKIKNPADPKEVLEFQQGIWRYHPKTKQFELFAEGGGNTYGLDFDKYGRCIAGTNWGGFAMLHQVQGGYYVKGFSKHGPLHNPHTYGYFDHVPYEGFKGGHVTCGGIVYQADAYPKEFQDQYIAGNLLSNAVYWHKMTEKGSTFTAKHGGDILISNDTWFRPVDCFQGPDGSVYVADWYDKRAAHLDPIDNWDKTNGRVYRIEYTGERSGVSRPMMSFDLRKKTSAELVELLKHPNKWWRNEARRLLAERQDKSVVPTLKKQALEGKGLLALESLWALYQLGGLDDETALKLLDHPNEHVRAWVVRFQGDRPQAPTKSKPPHGADVPSSVAANLIRMAWEERSPTVRSQLACTAKRLQSTPGLWIATRLTKSNESEDAHIPLLIWWALEGHFDAFVGPEPIVDIDYWRRWLEDDNFWNSKLTREFLAERIARRAVAQDLTGPEKHANTALRFTHTADLFELAPAAVRPSLIRGVEAGLDGRRADPLPANLVKVFDELVSTNPADDNLFRVRVRFNHGDPLKEAHARLADPKRPDADKVKLIQLLGQVRRPESLPVLLGLFRDGKSDAVRGAALTAAQSYGDPKVSDELLATFPKLTGALRQQALGILLSRPATALAVLKQVDDKKLDPKSIPTEQLRPVHDFKNEEIDRLVVKHWGKIGQATAGEKQARITWLNAELGRGPGDPMKGKELFTKNCAVCHTLFGEGAKVGPDLTTADRKNRGYMLTHIVDPSLYIRPEFMSYNVTTQDGRRLSGLVTEATEAGVTLNNYIENKVVKTVLSKKDIDEMLPSAVSLMPEKLLDTLSYQEIRDLFAYLQTDGPKEKSPPGVPAKEPAKDPASPRRKPGEEPAKDAAKLKVLLISGSLEYKSDDSLAAFQKHLEATYPVTCARAFRKTDEDIPGLDELDKCDVAVFFTRRLKPNDEQLARIKKYVTSGKPIVAIRTASHGFQNWLDMDKEVLGGDYKGHYGHDQRPDVKLTASGEKHPVLAGVKPFQGTGGLYKNPEVSKEVSVLMTGTIPDHTEPVTWVRDYKGGRVFYTSLGHPDDFKDPNFVRLLTNSVFWTAKKDVPK